MQIMNPADAPPGTIIIPTTDEQSVLTTPTVANQTTAQMATTTAQQPATMTMLNRATIPSLAGTTITTRKQQATPTTRTIVQQPDGSWRIQHMKLRISDKASSRMSIQNLGAQDKARGDMCAEGWTNISLIGKPFRIIMESERTVDLVGFSNDLEKNAVPVSSGLAVATIGQGTRILIGVHEAAHLPNNQCSLLSTGQAREESSTWVDDVLERHGGGQRIVAKSQGDVSVDVAIAMVSKDGLCTVEDLSYPTDEELDKLPRVWLTVGDRPWDPSRLDQTDGVILPCWDGKTELNIVTNMAKLDEASTFVKAVARQCTVAQGLWYLSGMVVLSNVMRATWRSFAGIMPTGSRAKWSERDWEWFRPRLGWIPLAQVKKTFDATTQRAGKVPLRFPMRHHFKLRFPQLNRPRLAETFSTDTLFSSEKALNRIQCAQLFTGNKSNYTAVYGMKHESEGPGVMEDFVREKGAPYAIPNDNSQMQLGLKWKEILRKYNMAAKNTPMAEHW